jgi:hypothetical protein
LFCSYARGNFFISIVIEVTSREEHRGFLRTVVRIFGPKREENESWRKLHNDELHILYSSANIVRMMKSMKFKWAGHVARVGEGRGVYRVLLGSPEGKRPLEGVGVGWRITLRWTLLG